MLQLQDEQEIVLTCQVLAEMGFGITRRLVKTIANNYIRENNIPTPFRDGRPGKDWWQRFMKRWPSLTQRKPQHLSKSRAQAANNMHSLTRWKRAIMRVGLTWKIPQLHIEYGTVMRLPFAPQPHPASCYANAVLNHFMRLVEAHITVHVCCSASGQIFFMYIEHSLGKGRPHTGSLQYTQMTTPCWLSGGVRTALPFGLRSAPKIFSAFADTLAWVLWSRGIKWKLPVQHTNKLCSLSTYLIRSETALNTLKCR